MSTCPICSEPLEQEPDLRVYYPDIYFSCLRCGKFLIDGDLFGELSDHLSGQHRRSVLSHHIRCMFQAGGKTVSVRRKDLTAWHLDDPLPSPAEQLDRLILWIADHQPSPAEYAESPTSAASAWILRDSHIF